MTPDLSRLYFVNRAACPRCPALLTQRYTGGCTLPVPVSVISLVQISRRDRSGSGAEPVEGSGALDRLFCTGGPL